MHHEPQDMVSVKSNHLPQNSRSTVPWDQTVHKQDRQAGRQNRRKGGLTLKSINEDLGNFSLFAQFFISTVHICKMKKSN